MSYGDRIINLCCTSLWHRFTLPHIVMLLLDKERITRCSYTLHCGTPEYYTTTWLLYGSRIIYSNLLCTSLRQGTKLRGCAWFSYTCICLYSNMVVYDKSFNVPGSARFSHAVIVQHGCALWWSCLHKIYYALRFDSAPRGSTCTPHCTATWLL